MLVSFSTFFFMGNARRIYLYKINCNKLYIYIYNLTRTAYSKLTQNWAELTNMKILIWNCHENIDNFYVLYIYLCIMHLREVFAVTFNYWETWYLLWTFSFDILQVILSFKSLKSFLNEYLKYSIYVRYNWDLKKWTFRNMRKIS